MSTIFLSHSHTDKPFARRLATDLRKAGHGVWIDEAEINIGDSLIEKIRNGLDQVDYVAAILSSSSINSPWVIRELDIASNREIDEKRVIVLPLLIEKVQLPGFLKGKFYGDFTDPVQYEAMFSLLLRKLGDSTEPTQPQIDELGFLRAQLEIAQAVAAQHVASLEAHQKILLRGKSEKLVAEIKAANAKFPFHAPINITHAFELGDMPVTLDYLLWAIAKSQRRGAHPLEIMLTLEDKWPEAIAMLEAYDALLSGVEK